MAGLALLMLASPLAGAALVEGEPALLGVGEFTVDPDALCEVRDQWVEQLLATHPQGTWAPMKFEPTDAQLALLGLPPARVLMAQRYPVPTAVFPDGTTVPVDLELALGNLALASYAGTGCLGIRPGAWLLLIDGSGIGWCSLAHVYGSPGAYDISTAGHCGKGGDLGTVIAAVGNFRRTLLGEEVQAPILLDFGKFSSSKAGDIGNDQALIDVFPQFQHLVTPTMCAWAGPRGLFTSQGAIAEASTFGRGGRIDPSVTLNPAPFLAQPILHYGHGAGIGAGGTPRAGVAQHWDASYFTFVGAIAPGDSGSGANTAGGDGVGEANEAAGIITHLYVDPSLRTGLGTMAGTRATRVGGTLALGQLAAYPAPVPLLP